MQKTVHKNAFYTFFMHCLAHFSTQNKYDFTKSLQKSYSLFISSTFWLRAARLCSSDRTLVVKFS